MNLHKYTEQELRDAVASSESARQVLVKLGVAAYGGNYATFRKAVQYFSINISHFTGRGWRKGRKFQPKRDIQEYLSNKFPCTSNRLRLRLLKEQIFQHQCSMCLSKKWLDKPIPLELDHINGNSIDNSLSNLRLLCPNCHAFTQTYRGRGAKNQKRYITVTAETRKTKEHLGVKTADRKREEKSVPFTTGKPSSKLYNTVRAVT